MSYNVIKRQKRERAKRTCTDHELSEQVSETKFRCPHCGVTEDIRSLDDDSRSMSAGSAIDTGRAQY